MTGPLLRERAQSFTHCTGAPPGALPMPACRDHPSRPQRPHLGPGRSHVDKRPPPTIQRVGRCGQAVRPEELPGCSGPTEAVLHPQQGFEAPNLPTGRLALPDLGPPALKGSQGPSPTAEGGQVWGCPLHTVGEGAARPLERIRVSQEPEDTLLGSPTAVPMLPPAPQQPPGLSLAQGRTEHCAVCPGGTPAPQSPHRSSAQGPGSALAAYL